MTLSVILHDAFAEDIDDCAVLRFALTQRGFRHSGGSGVAHRYHRPEVFSLPGYKCSPVRQDVPPHPAFRGDDQFVVVYLFTV